MEPNNIYYLKRLENIFHNIKQFKGSIWDYGNALSGVNYFLSK